MCSGAIKIATVVRGYHVYKDIWAVPVGEILFCQRETVAIVEEVKLLATCGEKSHQFVLYFFCPGQ